MITDFPARKAATRGFRLGAPRTFTLSEDGVQVLFLRSDGPTDPVNHLWRARLIDHRWSEDRLVDAAALLGGSDENLPSEEKARRERLREVSGGITGYSGAVDGQTVAFVLSGQLWVWAEGADDLRRLGEESGYTAPTISPDGRWVAAARAGGVELFATDGSEHRTLGSSDHSDVSWGTAEFIAAEEMERFAGMWWSPDSDRLLMTKVDDSPVGKWWISDPSEPAAPATPVRYPAAGTDNAFVSLHLVDLAGVMREVTWDRDEWEYLARVRWDDRGPLVALQDRSQSSVLTAAVDPGSGTLRELRRDSQGPWVELVPGAPRWMDWGLAVVEVNGSTDTRRLVVLDDSGTPACTTPPGLQVHSLSAHDADSVTFVGSDVDPSSCDLWRLSRDGTLTRLSEAGGWASGTTRSRSTVVARASLDSATSVVTVSAGGASWVVPSHAEAPDLDIAPVFLTDEHGWSRIAVLFPAGGRAGELEERLPVIMSPYGGPHSQRSLRAAGAFATEQWLADQGFCVIVADGPGSPSRPSNEFTIHRDLADPPLAGQVSALEQVAAEFGDRIDTNRVGIRGWSFGGYLAALAVLERPDVFHAAVAGAPVTDWALYDTHYTERYLGTPHTDPEAYAHSSLLGRAAGSAGRPLLLIHGLADDNVVAAHTLRLSSALLAAGADHEVLPLSGVTHMTPQEVVARNLLLRELTFFAQHLLSEASTDSEATE